MAAEPLEKNGNGNGSVRIDKNAVIVYLWRTVVAVLGWLALQDHNRINDLANNQAKDANRITIQETLSPNLKERLDRIETKLDTIIGQSASERRQ